MSDIKVNRAKKIKKLDITAGDYYKNAPGDISTRQRSQSKNKIDLSNLEDITEATITGGTRIEYTENNFKKALGTLESVITKTKLDQEKKVELKSLVRQLKGLNPGAEPTLIQNIWKKITGIVKLAGLAKGAAPLLQSVWPYVEGYLKNV